MSVFRWRLPDLLAASSFLFGILVSPAAAQLLGPEFQVNSYTTGKQSSPSVGMNSAGEFVVVWQDAGQDGSAYGVFAQRFGANGSPIGGEFQVNSFSTGSQTAPDGAMGDSGGFVVVWGSFGQDGSGWGVFARRFDPSGVPEGPEFQVNTFTSGDQFRPAVALDGAENFVVVWESLGQNGPYRSVFGQRFDTAGLPVGPEFQVNTSTTNVDLRVAVGMDGSGSFFVAWATRIEPGPMIPPYGDVFARRFDPAGVPSGPEFQVNSYATDKQDGPAVAVDPAGNVVVLWNSYLPGGTYWGVRGQRFDSQGLPAGGEFGVSSASTRAFGPAVAAGDSGDFVAVWSDWGQAASRPDVFARRFDPEGRIGGSELPVNGYTTNSQVAGDVATDGSGTFVVVWESDGQDGSAYGVIGRRLTLAFFRDGFESGDFGAWSLVCNSGDTCP